MQIEFLKYCPWSYRLTKGHLGATVKHQKGDTAQVVDVEALAMIGAGYAEECKPKHKPFEHKNVRSKKKRKVKKDA